MHPRSGDVPVEQAFRALSDPTRRRVIEQLGAGPTTVSQLADGSGMAMTSFLQHLRRLEEAGLVRSEKAGRVRTVHLRPAGLDVVGGWLDAQRRLWDSRLDQLDDHLATIQEHDHDR